MPQAEGRVYRIDGLEQIHTDYLETIPFVPKGQGVGITVVTDEFVAVCPFSGLPDMGKLTVNYFPSDRIVELKSLKYYLVSYHNVGIYQEAVIERVFADLEALLHPIYLEVVLSYNRRGGLDVTCWKQEGRRPYHDTKLLFQRFSEPFPVKRR
jgi:7-cyano-7-deazaguanine reductase